MELYADLDLHSRNTSIGIMDDAFTAFKIACQYSNQAQHACFNWLFVFLFILFFP